MIFLKNSSGSVSLLKVKFLLNGKIKNFIFSFALIKFIEDKNKDMAKINIKY